MEQFDFRTLPFLNRKMLAFEQGTAFGISIDYWAQSTQNIQVAGYTKDGPFIHNFDPTDGAGFVTQDFSLTDIPIAITLSSNVEAYRKGDFYAVMYLTMNGTRVQQLTKGYVTGMGGLCWPATNGQDPLENLGAPRVFTSNDPAAGSEPQVEMTGLVVNELQAVAVSLVTSASVANRRVHLVVGISGGNMPLNFFGSTNQPASTTRKYTFAAQGYVPDETDDDDILIPIPPNILMTSNVLIYTETTNLQAGDNFGVMRVLTKQHLAVN